MLFRSVGAAGGAANIIELYSTDGDGTVCSIDDASQVTVSASGSATIAESMPITFENGIATINVSDAIAEGILLSLSSGPAGIDVSDTLAITYVP